jgi:hypothetical protein
LTCVVTVILPTTRAAGTAAPTSQNADPGTARLDASVAAGLAYLARQQEPDGSFEGGGPKCAVTALSLMSFLATGNTPDVGRYGPTVRRALDFLIKQAPEDGYFGRVDGSRMYGQGIITLALAEAYGAEPDPARREAMRPVLTRALAVILKAQDVKKDDANAGGWRYEPQSSDSDLSLSGWSALSLRAAQNVGLDVPRERVDRARAYVLKCYNKLQRGFSYQPHQECTVSMTGVAVLNLYLLDAADAPEVAAGVRFLVEHPIARTTRFPYYSLYYATQAAFQAGEPAWPAVWGNAQDQLLSEQSPDGGWPQSRSGEEPGRIYATSLAVLTLSVPQRLLPTYQR